MSTREERRRQRTGDGRVYGDGRRSPERRPAPSPLPERDEPKLHEPGLRDLSRRDYLAILKRAFKESLADNITDVAAALAYYAFLAIPAVLLVIAGVFSITAGPNAVDTIIGKLGAVGAPSQARTLLRENLTNLTNAHGTGLSLIGIGTALAIWSLSGAMQNVMWALNVAYDRDETRGFVRRRLTALEMLGLAFLAFALIFGLLVLGPHLSTWAGNALGATTAVRWAWWVGQWPILLLGLLLAFAGILRLGPNVEQPRWRFLTLGAVCAIVIWLVASGAFAFYVSRFGSYNKTWGTLSAVVVMLTWLWLSALALLFGAEIDAEVERSRELRRGERAERELQAPAKA